MEYGGKPLEALIGLPLFEDLEIDIRALLYCEMDHKLTKRSLLGNFPPSHKKLKLPFDLGLFCRSRYIRLHIIDTHPLERHVTPCPEKQY